MLLAIPYFSFTTFSIGPLTLHAWGLWVALGFLAGIALAVQTARRRGVNADAVFDLGFWIILGAMVFARLTYIVGDLSFYLSHPLEILRIWEGGLTIYGGYLGAAVATLLVMRWKHWRFGITRMSSRLRFPLGSSLAGWDVSRSTIIQANSHLCHGGLVTSGLFGMKPDCMIRSMG